MDSNHETAIELSRGKIVALFLVACGFVAAGTWLVSLDDTFIQSFRRFNNPIVAHGVGLASMVFFGLCGLFSVKKLFDRKPGLVFNSSGFLDNSGGASVGFVPWSDVVGFAIFEVQKQKMLVIKVKDPQVYVESGSVLKRALKRANHQLCGSPIVISSNALRVTFWELLAVFGQYRQTYGRA